MTCMSYCHSTIFIVAGSYWRAIMNGTRSRIAPVPMQGLWPMCCNATAGASPMRRHSVGISAQATL